MGQDLSSKDALLELSDVDSATIFLSRLTAAFHFMAKTPNSKAP